MNRWTHLWLKYKQNQRKVAKVCSIVLTVLIVFLAGYAILSIVKADKARADAASGITASESPLVDDRNRDYGEPGLKKVAETDGWILYADTTNGEMAVESKSNGKIWYTNPLDREEDTYIAKKARLESQIELTFFTPTNNSTATADSLNECVKKGGLDYELIDGGIRFIYSFPRYGVRFPIEYTINENGLVVEVLMGEVEEYLTDQYQLITIDVLPFFGAGGLAEEGYLFVPDGSGALINYNNEKQRFAQYSAPVYGKDLVEPGDTTEIIRKEQITMPVFGLKTEENAFLAIITSNEAYATITATTSKKSSAYNQVYSTVAYRDYDVPTGQRGHNTVQYNESTEPFSDGSYRVEYFFLEGDAANYSGMANRYRQWLIENNSLHQSELVQEPYFVLNLYGAVSIEQYVMGFKQPVVTALTTYQDVIDIVSEMKSRGIDKIILNYMGAMNGGLNAELTDEFRTENVLGSKRDFEDMLQYLEQEDVIFFMEQDPINLYQDGNGYTRNEDTTTSFYDKDIVIYGYQLNQRKYQKSTARSLMKPSLLEQITDRYFSSAIENELMNYSAAGIGSVLYSDYDEQCTVYRQESRSIWQSILKTASEQFEYVMVEKGNAYTFPYVDIIRDIAVEDSGYDMIDESIPFYQMVVRGNIAISSSALNLNVDYHHQYLKGLETGTNMSYTWIAGDVLSLVGTEYNNLVSTSFDYWLDTAVQEYLDAKELMELTAGKAIVGHRKVAEEVFETTYDGGIRVYVNYSDSEYTDGDLTVTERGFAVVR